MQVYRAVPGSVKAVTADLAHAEYHRYYRGAREREAESPIIVAEGLSKTFQVAAYQRTLPSRPRRVVRRQYRRVEAVRQVSFAVEPGICLGLIGPNGAGKSTTIKMMTGVLYPAAGAARHLHLAAALRLHRLLPGGLPDRERRRRARGAGHGADHRAVRRALLRLLAA
jgi:ABC-type glutathione transport system ATPase component